MHKQYFCKITLEIFINMHVGDENEKHNNETTLLYKQKPLHG